MESYGKRSDAHVDELELIWGKLIPNKLKGKKTEEQEAARDKFLACLYLGGADRERHGKTIEDLNNDFVGGKGSYPESVSSMQQLMENRRGGGGKSKKVVDIEDGLRATSFTQQQFKTKKKCYLCGKQGHIAKFCPEQQQQQHQQVERTDENDSVASSQSTRSGRSRGSGRSGGGNPQTITGWHGYPTSFGNY